MLETTKFYNSISIDINVIEFEISVSKTSRMKGLDARDDTFDHIAQCGLRHRLS